MNSLLTDEMMRLTMKGLDASALRQRTIAHNLANINTPGFKRSEVKFEEKLSQVMGAGSGTRLAVTDAKHIGVVNDDQPQAEVVRTSGTTQRQDGNNVNLEIDLTNMAINEILYRSLIQQMNDRIGNLRHVITEGRG